MLSGATITLEATGYYTDNAGNRRLAISASTTVVIMSRLPVRQPVLLSYFDPLACGLRVRCLHYGRMIEGVLLRDGSVFINSQYVARVKWPQRPKKSVWERHYNPLAANLGY